MELFNIVAILLVMSATFSYINHRFLKLPTTIGLLLIALLLSVLLNATHAFFPELTMPIKKIVHEIDFSQVIIDIMLSFLLFAGTLHLDMKEMRKQGFPILVLTIAGVVISMFLVAFMMYYLLILLGLPTDFIYCLLFGALISPTDPIAVLGMLKAANAPKSLEMKIAGESLFNDGVGVVAFLTVLKIAIGTQEISVGDTTLLFVQEVVGGVVFGVALGFLSAWLMRSIDSYIVEVLISLATVMGGYALAYQLEISGPLAIVVAGMIVGNRGHSEENVTEEYVDKFWELIDEILNSLLFILIGLEVLEIKFTMQEILAGMLAIVVVLLSRFISVIIPLGLMRTKRFFPPYTARIMTWGGLRGGLSVALALSLPATMPKELLVSITYMVVIFSISVQGLSMKSLLKKAREASLLIEAKEKEEANT